MGKIAIFYHIHQANHWVSLFERQIYRLQQSGVYDAASYIHFGVNGDLPLPYDLIKVNSVKRNKRIDLESDTLADLHSFCKENLDYKVLYIHTKTVSHKYEKDNPQYDYMQPYWDNMHHWLTYIEYFNVIRWRESVELLNKYDCVGTEWDKIADIAKIQMPMPHYAGNFWWANASYISKLDTNFLYVDNGRTRHQGEFWIGTGNPNYFNHFSSNRCKYLNAVLPHEYENLPIQMR